MAKIRELQPAHESDKVTVDEAARAFKKIQDHSRKRDGSSAVLYDKQYIRRDRSTGRFVAERAEASEPLSRKNGRAKAKKQAV